MSMLRFRHAIGACVAVACVAGAGNARANGRFPAANQLVVSQSDPNYLVLRTTFGILFSHDQGTTWDWICEKGVGYGGVEDPSMGILQSGVIAGVFSGLAYSPDQGCSWSLAFTQPVVDVVVRWDDPHGAYAITSAYAGAGDGGETTFTSNVYATKNDGAAWTKVGDAIDPDILLETIEIAKSDPHRIYLSGVRTAPDPTVDGGTTTTLVVLASTDDGAHYTQSVIDADPRTERAPFISAVDPSNAERVYVRVKGVNGSRVVVSDDGGKTFRSVFTAQGDLLGFALSPDGSKVYTGGPLDGVMFATSKDLAFTKKADIQVQCLTTIGTTLYACSNEASGFIVGTSTDDGATFTAKTHLGCMRGPLACPSSASTAQCAADYPALAQQLAVGASCGPSADGGGGDDDAGSSDADADGAQPGGGGGGGSSGCTASPSGPAFGVGLAAIAAALALGARRKKRRA